MAYAHGIVHHAVRVGRHTKPVFGKSPPHVVGKTAAHKEHARTGGYLKGGMGYLYMRLQLHHVLKSVGCLCKSKKIGHNRQTSAHFFCRLLPHPAALVREGDGVYKT